MATNYIRMRIKEYTEIFQISPFGIYKAHEFNRTKCGSKYIWYLIFDKLYVYTMIIY